MNYVAHAFLAPREPIALLGNMLGDFVKGPLPGGLDAELAAAVAEHRALDARCDSHPAFRRSRQRLFGAFSHYAGVIVDVLFDHILYLEWGRYADERYDDFVDGVYAMVRSHRVHLPTDLAEEAGRLVDADAFRRYRTEDELREALRRLARRTKRRVVLADAVDHLVRDRAAFAEDFRALFDDLTATAGRA